MCMNTARASTSITKHFILQTGFKRLNKHTYRLMLLTHWWISVDDRQYFNCNLNGFSHQPHRNNCNAKPNTWAVRRNFLCKTITKRKWNENSNATFWSIWHVIDYKTSRFQTPNKKKGGIKMRFNPKKICYRFSQCYHCRINSLVDL